MAVYRLQVEMIQDSALPRDSMVITPHFNATVADDPDGLCEDLADAIVGWSGIASHVKVTAYDAQGTPPVFPVGSAERNAGAEYVSNLPREIACCLSFYSERNLPRQRGRLYIPMAFLTLGGVGTIGARPSLIQRTKVGALAAILSDLGGIDVDWSVYSRTDDTPRGVTNWWVDDEWDTVRSRGLRATTRTVGTVSDG